MTSKIKVDNIENQCGGAVVTKCGATTTISGSVVKADDIQAVDGGNLINQCGTTITLGASGDTIELAAGASQTGFGRTGTVDWDTTAKTASFTAVSGNGYFVNTTSGAITVTLPATPSAGDIVSIADYTNTFQTNNLTIAPNGSNIGGVVADATLNVQGQSVTFVYVDSTQGWKNVQDSTSNVIGAIPFMTATGGTVTCCGDYKIHIFTGPGTFTVCNVSNVCASRNGVDYLVVAGGGGAGTQSGGGGGGGFRVSNSLGCISASPLANPTGITVTAQAYPITVGAGGAACATNGADSVGLGITSAGGGRSTGWNSGPGFAGGSGAGGSSSSGTNSGGAGNTPPVSPPQGNAGGPSSSANAGGGGGGASAAGQSTSGSLASGGDGSFAVNDFFGPTAPSYGQTGPSGRYFSGGGGGGIRYPDVSPSSGSAGLGGGGYAVGCAVGVPGTVNTGGGGGGGSWSGPGGSRAGGTGGSGIVIIRYKFQ